jgi:PAS domain-containing protein
VSPAMCRPHPTEPLALADAAALGLSALAEVLARTEDGICVVDTERRYVYANPAACRMLGYPLEQLRGRDFLASFPAREHVTVLGNLPGRLGDRGLQQPRLRAAACQRENEEPGLGFLR